MPVPLLTDADLSARARLLYGQLQGVPGFKHPTGIFTYPTLSRLTGNSDDTLRCAVTELVAAQWLTLSRTNRRSPLSFTLCNPARALLSARISSIRRHVNKDARYKGETLLREFLNALVDLEGCQEDAAPDCLINPFTGELMEFDRYYPTAGVAFEFQGDQHFEPNELATYTETVKQVGRDAMKAFIAKTRGIELVIVRPEELRLSALERKLPRRLPRRDLEGLKPLFDALEELACTYRQRTADERGRRFDHDVPRQ